MLLKEINNTFVLVWSHIIARIAFILIIFIAILLSLFYSIFSSITILISYFLGYALSFCLVKYRFEVGFYLQRLAKFYHGHITPKKKKIVGCNICDKHDCKRHLHMPAKEPWKGLFLNKNLNQAIENIYNKILDNFVCSWYANFTDDVSFVDELRSSVRHATSNLVLRYLEIDVGNTIANKLIPCAIKHIEDCIQIQEKSEKNNIKIEQAAISHLGRKMHVATTNRENEMEYLRQLTSNILPLLLSKHNLNCANFNYLIREIVASWVFLPLMDVIADPNIINLLLNLTISYKKKHYHKSWNRTLERVEILQNFTNYKNIKSAALGYDLSKVFKNQDILHAFIKFLKEEGPLNLLQFCLNVEDFNTKLLTPELSRKDVEILYTEATQIFQSYLKETSADFIGSPAEINNNIQYLLIEGPNNISKFRTSTPLYKAYDFAYNILENQWLPLFFHKDEFYNLACGTKISANYRKSPVNKLSMQTQGSPLKTRSNKKWNDSGNQGTVSKISSGFTKIKGALRTQPVEGAVYQSDPQSYEADSPLFIEQNINRDLSCWRVSINQVEQGMANSKPIYIYYINVKRIDTCSESERYWTVHRHDQDFHTLKIKLIEFHGENEICNSPLPSRRSTTPKETKRQKYEEFLQKLLQKPSLRGSDLLYTFLTTKKNFTSLADTSVPIVSDLENIYQSVAHKLRKEKGQRLDSFMATFLASTETGQLKLKYENPDVGEEANSDLLLEKSSNFKPRNLKNSIFENNLNIFLPENIVYPPSTFNPQNFIECSFYMLRNIFRAPNSLMQVYNAICNIGSQAVDYITRSLIEKQLKTALSEHTLAQLVTLLQDVLFCDKLTLPTKHELEQRKVTAFHNLANLNTGFICHWLGLDIKKGLVTILQILQHPQLNKQLAYSLLDILVLELFPDCNLNDS